MNFQYSRKADLLIAGIDDSLMLSFTKKLWISRTYMSDDMTWCVAKVKPCPLWSNIFQIFTFITWIAVLTTIFTIAVIIKYFLRIDKRSENYMWALLLSIAAIIGKSITYNPSRVSIRVMMVFLFLYGLIISTSFCTFLISSLTQPRFGRQIDNLPDAIKAGFKFASGDSGYYHYIGEDPVTNEIRSQTFI